MQTLIGIRYIARNVEVGLLREIRIWGNEAHYRKYWNS